MDIRILERLLPPSPPLAVRWMAYRCADCGTHSRLDLRVQRLPGARLLIRNGWATMTCHGCGGKRPAVEGLVFS